MTIKNGYGIKNMDKRQKNIENKELDCPKSSNFVVEDCPKGLSLQDWQSCWIRTIENAKYRVEDLCNLLLVSLRSKAKEQGVPSKHLTTIRYETAQGCIFSPLHLPQGDWRYLIVGCK